MSRLSEGQRKRGVIAASARNHAEFPQHPGALLKFFSGLGQRWNIPLFCYRNHDAAYGRILIQIQASGGRRRQFEQVLDSIAFPSSEETNNRAYQLYLDGSLK
tara:strand:- start:25409 stop:25717 length:309 start_codon:yes stop_codon:yes gene_type:complete